MRQTDVIVMEGTETECRLWEIAENLHRADLTPQERAAHVAEWMRLTMESQTEEVSAQLGQKLPQKGVGQGVGGGRPEGGISAAVRELGITRQDAQRALKIDGISPEAKQIARETGLDNNQTALLAVARRGFTPSSSPVQDAGPGSRSRTPPAQSFSLPSPWRGTLPPVHQEPCGSVHQ